MFQRIALIVLAIAGLAVPPRQAAAQVYFGGYGVTSLPYPQSQGYTVFTYIPQAPKAKFDNRIDPHLIKAANIAAHHALPHSIFRCWQYVKNALLESGAIGDYPKTNYACEAGSELVNRYGFVRMSIHDPYRAPIGAVLVYEGGGAGHVEIRTRDGFASDYQSPWRCKYRLVGVYAKFSA